MKCSTELNFKKKATTSTLGNMYVALDLGQKNIQVVLKNKDGKIIKENKIQRNTKTILEFIENNKKDGNIDIVMEESGYNYQYLYDLLQDEGYNVKVAHPLMVKAIAYAKVKTDKVDARILADLLRMDMIPECYIPNKEIRDLRDLVRRRYYFVSIRTMFKNKVHVEMSKRWLDANVTNNITTTMIKNDTFSKNGKCHLRSLRIPALDDCLDTIDFLDRKIKELDTEIKKLAIEDKYSKHLLTIPGISYYAALLISSEIADIDRFPDYEHLCYYARLVPGTYQSGSTSFSKTDKKQGSKMLNWIMVQCTHTHVRYCQSSITMHYNKIKNRRRNNKIAIIAAARKLMRVIYVMLKEDRPFRLDE